MHRIFSLPPLMRSNEQYLAEGKPDGRAFIHWLRAQTPDDPMNEEIIAAYLAKEAAVAETVAAAVVVPEPVGPAPGMINDPQTVQALAAQAAAASEELMSTARSGAFGVAAAPGLEDMAGGEAGDVLAEGDADAGASAAAQAAIGTAAGIAGAAGVAVSLVKRNLGVDFLSEVT